MNEIFYHASNTGGLKELLPLSKMHGSGESVCYVTPFRAYALFYLRDMEINHVTAGVSKDGVAIYHEQFEGQLETLYQRRSGYLYTCEGSRNIISAHANGVWASMQPVAVSSEEYICDVYAEILKAEQSGVIKVLRYSALSNEKKDEIVDMIKTEIIKGNYLYDTSSPKARFYCTHFPQSWAHAQQQTAK